MGVRNLYFLKKFRGAFIYLPILIEVIYFLRFLNPLSESLGVEDWDLNFFYLESSLIPFRDYLEIPIWNSYYGSGYPIFENPQSKLFSLTWFLGLGFGSLIGLKLSIYFYYMIGGFGGIYLFFKQLKFSYLISLLCTNLFIFCGTVSLHLYAGHAMFASGLLIPLGVGFFLKARETKNYFYISLSALVFANLIFEGAVYYFVYCVFGYCIILLFYRAELISFFKVHFSFLLILFLLILHRLIPAWIYLNTAGAYFVEDNSYMGVFELWKVFTISSQHPYVKNWESQTYNWWEYGNYIGMYSIFIFFVIVTQIKRNQIPLLVLLVLLILLMMGKFHDYSPASLLSKIPIFSRQRCFGRWGILVVFIFSILFGLLVNNIDEKIKNLKVKFIFSALIFLFFCFSSYDLLKFNSKYFKEIFNLQIDFNRLKNLNQFPVTISSLPNYGGASAMYPALVSGLITRDGYEMLNATGKRKAKGEKDYKGEFYLEKGGHFLKTTWTPNKIHFVIDSDTEDYLHINLGYNLGWRIPDRKIYSDQDGLIMVKVNKGVNDLILTFYYDYYTWGLLGLATGLLFIFYTMFKSKKLN